MERIIDDGDSLSYSVNNFLIRKGCLGILILYAGVESGNLAAMVIHIHLVLISVKTHCSNIEPSVIILSKLLFSIFST